MDISCQRARGKKNCIERVTSMRVVSFVSSTHLRKYSLPHESLCDRKPCDSVCVCALRHASKRAVSMIWCFGGALCFVLPYELDLIEALVLFWDGEVGKRLLSLELSSAAGKLASHQHHLSFTACLSQSCQH